MIQTLDIASHGALKLPLDFVTERIAFLARTGSGKSGGMRVLFEQFLRAGQFVIFVDPKGDAWGIRASGAGTGFPVLVMGGDHADVPLQPTAGKFTAEFLVRERVPVVLDISDFGKTDMVRFVTDFATTLYRRNRDVVHVFIDEADMIAGEKFYDPKCLEAIQLIQNKGRHRGFGVTVATQRSAMLNKSVLFVSGTLVAMQTTGPRDIKAVREWLDIAGTPEATAEIIRALPTLKTREAFVYSPQHLGAKPKQITFRSFQTFDSMRTPKPGEARQQPKRLADIDLSAVQRDMAATIEEAKANDPAELKKQLAAVRRELEAAKKSQPAAAQPDRKVIEWAVRAAVAAERKRWEPIIDRAIKKLPVVPLQELAAEIEEVMQTLAEVRHESNPATGGQLVAEQFRAQTPVQPARPPRVPTSAQNYSNGELPRGEALTLAALIQFPEGLAREQLTVLTGYKRSTRDAYLQRLRERGFVTTDGATIMATNEGITAMPDAQPLPTGTELQEHWRARLPAGEQEILDVLIEAHPKAVSRDGLSETTGYKRSTRDAYLQRLKAKQLVVIERDGVRASNTLF